eukprot:127029-Prorocentrum_lima.AAC.1
MVGIERLYQEIGQGICQDKEETAVLLQALARGTKQQLQKVTKQSKYPKLQQVAARILEQRAAVTNNFG